MSRFLNGTILATLAATLLGNGLFLAPSAAAISGADFNPGNIISGAVFTDTSAMSPADIQNFLNAKVSCDTNGTGQKSYYFNSTTGRVGNSADPYVTTSRAVYGQRYNAYNSTAIAGAPYVCLKDYVENPASHVNNLQNPGAPIAGGISGASIIYNAAVQYSINPMVLLVTLQKENSLITDDWPWTNQYKTAMGYGCPDTAACSSTYYGFANQVTNAAKQFRRYLANPTEYNYVVGTNFVKYNPSATCGGTNINIENQSTAALYNYTPYQPNAAALSGLSSTSPGGGDGCSAYGNRNFWWYFNRWFGSTQTSVPYAWTMSSSVAYADAAGTVPYSPAPSLSIAPGGKAYLKIKARNNGNQTWNQANVRLGTSRERDRISAFADGSWLNGARIAMQETAVLPGDVATFSFALTATMPPSSRSECFNLVVEGATWMSGQDICYNIDVVAAQESNDQNLNLASGQSINRGEYLMSASAHTIASLQSDGNFVIYSDGAPRWNSGTAGTSASRLIMQSDGNLVLYNATGVPLWNTATSGNPGSQAIMQSDGNLVVYKSGGVPAWASATNNVPSFTNVVRHSLAAGVLLPQQSLQMADRSRQLVMQRDGNLVLYSSGQPVWATYTQGNPGASLVMQADGNAVIYSKDGRALWATYTNGNPGAYVVLQDDGNIVIYRSNNTPAWHSRTYGR